MAKRISLIGIKRRHEDINENKSAASKWGMPNYMPVSDPEEDEFSKQVHVGELKKQCYLRKSYQNAPFINCLMDKIFWD